MRRLELTEQEFQACCGLIDAGVRATGWRACQAGARLAQIFDAAPQLPEVASAGAPNDFTELRKGGETLPATEASNAEQRAFNARPSLRDSIVHDGVCV